MRFWVSLDGMTGAHHHLQASTWQAGSPFTYLNFYELKTVRIHFELKNVKNSKSFPSDLGVDWPTAMMEDQDFSKSFI